MQLPDLRSLYVPDSEISGWHGVRVYRVVTGLMTPVTYTPIARQFQFYEVSIVNPFGSWWQPTVAHSRRPTAWLNPPASPTEALDTSGVIPATEEGTDPIHRPANLFWWLPTGTLKSVRERYLPAYNRGQIKGTFPEVPPPVDSAPQAPVEPRVRWGSGGAKRAPVVKS